MVKRKLILKSSFTFDKKVAKKLVKADYYAAQGSNIKNLARIEKDKRLLSTPKWEYVTKILQYYRKMGLSSEGVSPIGKVLQAIYRKNKIAAQSKTKAINTKILGLVSHPELLMLAYREIRGNRGALTPGAEKTEQELRNMTEEQQRLYLKSQIFPDGFSLADVFLVSKLLRKQAYPWGASSRIYVDKPGVANKKRPITIPPFLDRVVQKAIELILHCIYEPKFETLNRSFGFRPNKGVHDAMAAIRSRKTNGMKTALEGDVEAAYDTVDKEKLLEILAKDIKDQKFLKLMKQRLKYTYVEKESGERVTPKLGIPQGGIDSPYLFNIYMHELDTFVHTELQEYVDKLNSKPFRDAFNKEYRHLRVANEKHLPRELRKIKLKFKELRLNKDRIPDKQYQEGIHVARKELYVLVRAIRLNNHKKNRVSSIDESKRTLAFFYTRYADDWILLTNGNKEVASTFKTKISEFLQRELKLKLSEEKTLITDIRKNPAKFLGFEIRRNVRGIQKRFPYIGKPNLYKKSYQKKAGGVVIWTAPDRQRLINRLHMKGFCSRTGFPQNIPWLAIYEPQVIIERFNASIRGLAQYYIGHIRNSSSMSRWIYILRYSCLKTLANKYNSSITKIFKRFGRNADDPTNSTVEVKVQLSINGKKYQKTWSLLTYKELKETIELRMYGDPYMKTFWDVELGQIGDYELKPGRIPKVTNEDYLNAISWVSLRTQSSFDMPCASCGTTDDIQMHHIKHVRKTAYVFIPDDVSYKRIMSIRNRKQIPLCEHCHRNVVHTGRYAGPRLKSLAPNTKLVDNRIIHVESFVQPGNPSIHFGKSLEDKGWSLIHLPDLTPDKDR